MAPTLPSSLSPHICILSSPDLQDLLNNASLPPLSQVLQSFTPLSQVTTRTTTLTSVPHASFALRFSELSEIEAATREDDEQRAGRTMDWIGARVATRAARWIELVEAAKDDKDSPWRSRTPWWEEVKRCVEGDHVPSKTEGWNHPVAIIYAVSTFAVNPLQALQELHARAVDLPPWVDGTHLRYSLIVHPSNSPLAEPIADALFNAVKKQYGLHSYLLSVTLPNSPLPAPVNVPLPIPRLPPISSMNYSPIPPVQVPNTLQNSATPSPAPSSLPPPLVNGTQDHPRPAPSPGPLLAPGNLHLSEGDIQQVGRFVREFAVMSLLPWMEKCVIDWNEVYSSSRRLPSRLFSSTRRLFGSGYNSSTSSAPATPTHGSNPSISSVASRFTSHAPNSSVSSLASVSSLTGGVGGTVTQQRRLAEFATILGDYKLAITVWESLRKESRGGSDVLPLLVSPSPALALHASNAITALSTLVIENPALAQMRALVYAVRWDIGIDNRDFLGPVLEGDRWLVQAAGAAEEPPTALLLGHAAHLCVRRGSRRRAALWYLFAGDRLEKAGIKPLALYFFRQSHQLYRSPLPKELSPAFWEGEGKDPKDWRGFEGIMPGIEHELGRLLYTTGDTEGAVRYFLGLLRGSVPHHSLPPPPRPPTGLGLTDGDAHMNGKTLPAPADRMYLEDFRVALKHFKDTEPKRWSALELKLPAKFCHVKQTRLRLPGDAVDGDPEVWRMIEEDWEVYWRPRGKERLEPSGKAAVDEAFWVDLAIDNPLDVEITISNLTVLTKDANDADPASIPDFVETEIVDEINLGAHETRTIPVAIKCSKPASLVITHVTFDFLSLLPITESLALRGRRLQDTPQQRQSKVYAPDILLQVDVEDATQRLQAHFVDDRHLVLAQGESRRMDIQLKNTGKDKIDELWLVPQNHQEVWVELDETGSPSAELPQMSEVLQSSNSLAPQEPFWISLGGGEVSLGPNEDISLALHLHAEQSGEHDLSLLLVFREAGASAFRSTRLTRHYEVRPILELSTSCEIAQGDEYPFTVYVDVKNTTSSSNIVIHQISTLSPVWSCSTLSTEALGNLLPRQSARIPFSADRWDERSGEETRDFVARRLRAVLHGEKIQPDDPPPVELLCRHVTKSRPPCSINDAATRHFIHTNRCRIVCRTTAASHPYIPARLHSSIFPLYNPSSLDVLVFWEIPAQGRTGHILLSGCTLGASHAPLRDIIAEVEGAAVKRSMYAETERERVDVLAAVKSSEWNAETVPIAIAVRDGEVVRHEFANGPVRVPVTYTLRNLSLTNPVRYALRLASRPPPSSDLTAELPAPHTGRLTHKGTLSPFACVTIQAKLWVTHPGTYALDTWSLEAEVGEVSASTSDSEVETEPWRTRQQYQLGPQAGVRSRVTVVDTSTPSSRT